VDDVFHAVGLKAKQELRTAPLHYASLRLVDVAVLNLLAGGVEVLANGIYQSSRSDCRIKAVILLRKVIG
jgi:hypothetical protein